MTEDLPEEFDLVVIGTGFTESCVAAAASRIGKTVLHVDPQEFYGGAWASFNLETFNAFLDTTHSVEVRNTSNKWYTTDTVEEAHVNEDDVHWTQAKVLEQSRRFNVDLCPRILYAAGQLVQLLISSNICRYAEFRAVDRVCTRFQEQVLSVPCSRSDVFNTKDLNMVEKRLLMKFLTVCMTYGEDKCAEDTAMYCGKTFHEYLKEQNLTDKIGTCIAQAIAMCDTETSFDEGMQRTKLFLNSLGRYGNTPFLFPMYGCGEIPQCFCRLCAVFGGIYCLKRHIDGIDVDAESGSVNVKLEGKPVRAKHVVCAHGNIPDGLRNDSRKLVPGLSRGVYICSTPLGDDEQNTGGGGVNLLRLVAGAREAVLIQLSHFSGTCPKGLFLFHLTTRALSENPAEDLQVFADQVFNAKERAPKLLYAAHFTLTTCAGTVNGTGDLHMPPIYCTSAPYYELDYDLSIKNAREIHAKMYENTEFLPRAPDPEEIVIEGEDPRALSETNLPDDLRAQLHELEAAAEEMDIADALADAESSNEELEYAQEMEAD